MKERKEFRREREKHFENADHSFTAAIYGQPVHFMENGEWKEIDNTVELKTDGRYENKSNDFKVSFAKDAADDKLVTVSREGHSLSWKVKSGLKTPVHTHKKSKEKAKDMEVVGLQSKVEYKNVFDGVDLEYVLNSKTLKENIILNKMLTDGKIVFEITTELHPETKDGRVNFKTDQGEEIFVMAKPYMFDANGETCHNIEVLCEGKRERGKVLYTLIPDLAWLVAEERKWPVTIDPVISSSKDSQAIYDSRIVSKYPTQNFNSDTKLAVGQDKTSGISRSLVNFDLPTLNPADMVISAVLNLTCGSNYGKTNHMHVHRVTSSWSASTVTWNTMPRYDNRIADSSIFADTTGSEIGFDVTEIVKDWYANGNQYGLLLKDSEEVGCYAEMYSANYSNADSRPKVTIRYVNYTGIQNFWTYHSQDVRRAGKVYVNDYNGNLIFTHLIDTISGNRMPYVVELVYNTNDKDTDIGYGKGMRLNYHQSIAAKTIDGVQYYEWIDGTGTHHFFNYKSEKWSDELNKDLVLTIGTTNAEKYIISNKQENKLIFNSSGLLVKIKDNNENQLVIAYANNKINSVTDGVGRALTFSYSGSAVITATNPAAKTKTLTLSSGYLTSIKDFDEKVITLGYTNGLLSSVLNYDGYKMGYTYTSNPAKVIDVKEYINNVEKRSLSIDYGFNSNKFTDERGRTETYIFNNMGHTVSVKNDKGYAQVSEYIKDGASVNKLAHVSKLLYTVPQLLKNPNLLDETSWIASVDTGVDASFNTDSAYTMKGSRSLKFSSSNVSLKGRFIQQISLEKGKEYVFSAYVKTSDEVAWGDNGGTFIGLTYKDSTGTDQVMESRKVMNASNDWEYVQVVFVLPEDASSTTVSVYCIHRYYHGNSYFAGLQIEEGNVGNRRNLIENNDFTYSLDDFYGTGIVDSLDKLIDTQYPPTVEFPQLLIGVVNADSLYVRSGPGSNYSVVTSVVNGDMVTILEACQGIDRIWYKIGFGINAFRYTGYVATEYVTVITDAGIRTGYVNADLLNVRSGAGTGYSVVVQLPTNSIVTILGSLTSGGINWYQINTAYQDVNYSGYVSAEFITEITAQDPSSCIDDREELYTNECALNSTVLCITGDPTVEKRMSQLLNVSGSAGDVFVISGWGLANALPIRGERAFGVELEFTYTDGTTEPIIANFDGDSNEWQYVNKVVIANKAYTSIKASYVYANNANKAYFDGLSVFKDEYWSSFTYDDKGNVITCADAKNQKTTFAYDTDNNITGVVTPKGSEFEYAYEDTENPHRITSAVTAADKKYTFEYDSFGNLVLYKFVDIYDENNFIRSQCVYTSDGNYPLKNTDYFGKETTFEYNSSTGNLTSVTDVNGKKTSYTYDAMGKLLSVSKPNIISGTESVVALNYTYEDDRIKTIRHNGMDYVFTYDGFGNVIQVSVGGQVLVTHTYTMNGSLLEKTVYANGYGRSYEYDEFDRLIKEYLINGITKTLSCEYIYNNEGQLCYKIDHINNEKTRYEYTLSGEVAFTELPSGEMVKYVYDSEHCLRSMELRDVYGITEHSMAYDYDRDHVEIFCYTTNETVIHRQYDLLGRLTRERRGSGNGFEMEYAYRSAVDGTGTPIVSSINFKDASENEYVMSYTYYNDGNIKQVTTPEGSVTYEYDYLGQLLRVNDSVHNKTSIYTYDAGFNMTSEKVYDYTTATTLTGTPISQRDFTYGSLWKDQLVSCDGAVLTYDAMGNLVSYDGTTYTWTDGRKLSGVTKADGTAVGYTYDLDGRRKNKIIGGQTTSYTYLGNLMICQKTGTETLKFSYNSIGNPVSILYNEVEYFYVKNLQGDIIGLVDATGAWMVKYSYDAWGNVLSVTGTLAATLGQKNPLRYRGYFYDSDTGLYYLGTRYYWPEICRFISPDGTTLLDAEPMKLTCKNLYTYCDNNPITKKDFNGQLPLPVIGAGVGALTYLVSTAVTGDEFNIIDLGVSIGLGALGAVNSFAVKHVVVNCFALSTVLDSAYVAFTHYRDSEDKNIVLSIAAGLANGALSLGSLSGMASLTEFKFADNVMENMIDFTCGFGNNLLMDTIGDMSDNSNPSKLKSNNTNKVIVYDANTRKQHFKEKQFKSTYKRDNYDRLTFMERRMNAF